MNKAKYKFLQLIGSLDKYINKLKENQIDIRNTIFDKKSYLSNIFNEINKISPEYQFNISQLMNSDQINESCLFLSNLIQIFNSEKEKPYDYYEKNPNQIQHIISMSYFSLFLYMTNKSSNSINKELSEIFGGMFSCLIQKMMNVQFLQYVRETKTKSNQLSLFRKNKFAIKEYNHLFTNKKSFIKKISKTFQNEPLNENKFNHSSNFKSKEKNEKRKKFINYLNEYISKFSINNSFNLKAENTTHSSTNNLNCSKYFLVSSSYSFCFSIKFLVLACKSLIKSSCSFSNSLFLYFFSLFIFS
jgi:hypothetical protein